MTIEDHPGAQSPERCFVIHPYRKSDQKLATRKPQARLNEAIGLAEAISLDVVQSETVPVSRVLPKTYIGTGGVERLGTIIAAQDIGLVIVDASLTPIQQRNLERIWKCKVIDRTGLILEIFGERARTREGVLQVELAALSYQRSRLVRSWTHLERQRGGHGFMGGPGETQIETDRRLIDQRITRVKKDLADVKRTRALHRQARKRVPYPVVALVGYTNAGKSTLFNYMTNSEMVAEDQLFATLDPTMRSLDLPSGRKIILSDTVGFISELPHELVTAFHATLEEVIEANIIIHVRDSAHQDSIAQKQDVNGVLKSLGITSESGSQIIEVMNKTDLLPPEELEIINNQVHRHDELVVPVSAVTGDGCDRLIAIIDDELSRSYETFNFLISLSDGAAIAWLYGHGEVSSRTDDEKNANMLVKMEPVALERFQRRFHYNPTD